MRLESIGGFEQDSGIGLDRGVWLALVKEDELETGTTGPAVEIYVWVVDGGKHRARSVWVADSGRDDASADLPIAGRGRRVRGEFP